MSIFSALAIVIPPQFHEQINVIRSKHDRAYPRWMPHINLIFPFVNSGLFSNIKTILKDITLEPFEIQLNVVDFFAQKKELTFHLRPKDDSKLQELYSKVIELLPDVSLKHNKFHPHMTLGHSMKNR